MTSGRAGFAVFATSAAVLVLEIIAGRLMAPYIGVSLVTFTAVIGTVLAAIAVGSAVGGWLADRHDPRRMIGPALVAGGALAWLSLPVVGVLGPGTTALPTSIVALTTAAFFLPAAVLSAISPMVAKLRLHSVDETGSVVGGLSAAGTAGALVGTFATGFVLIAALPSRPIVLGLGAVLVVAGVLVWWRLDRRRPTAGTTVAVVAGVLVAGLLGLQQSPPCQHETAYFCVNVDVDPDRPSGRVLQLDELRHAYVDLDDPTHLEFRYVRLFDDVAATLPPGPIDALHIGGGGFTFPRHLAAVRPGSDHLVLEIDATLVEIAEAELGLRLGPGMRVRTGDARLAFDDLPTDGYDLVVGDAFSSTSVPWHLTTVEVVGEIDRILRPDGIYVMNVIDGGANRYARAQLATLAERFDHLAVIVPSDGVPTARRTNQVLVASSSPLPALDVAATDGMVLDGPAVDDYIDGARPLTDDHAPVDHLLQG